MDPMAIVSGLSGKASSSSSNTRKSMTSAAVKTKTKTTTTSTLGGTPKIKHKQVKSKKGPEETLECPAPHFEEAAVAGDRNRSRSAPPGHESQGSHQQHRHATNNGIGGRKV